MHSKLVRESGWLCLLGSLRRAASPAPRTFKYNHPDSQNCSDGLTTANTAEGIYQSLIRYSAERAWAVRPSPRARTEATRPIRSAPLGLKPMRDERFWKS